jgi:hypothetical protein
MRSRAFADVEGELADRLSVDASQTPVARMDAAIFRSRFERKVTRLKLAG